MDRLLRTNKKVENGKVGKRIAGHPVDNRVIATRAWPGADALFEELHCSDVAAGGLG